MKLATKRFWRIEGADSLTPIFRKVVPLHHFSENQMRQLLCALEAKAHLDFDEIVAAYARRGSKSWVNHLEVHRDRLSDRQYMMWCGQFIANIVDEDGKIIRRS